MRWLTMAIVSVGAASAAAFPVDDRIGFGSRLTFTENIEFGRTRLKTFCNGEPSGLFGKVSLRMCCDLIVAGVAWDADVTWREGPRDVTWANWNYTKIIVDGSTSSGIRCTPNAVSEEVLRKAFGHYLSIERVAPSRHSTRRGPIEI